MHSKRLLVGIALATAWLVAPVDAFSYPIADCGSICFVAPRCRNECTGTITTCQEWWINCAGGGSFLSQVDSQASKAAGLDWLQAGSSDSQCSEQAVSLAVQTSN